MKIYCTRPDDVSRLCHDSKDEADCHQVLIVLNKLPFVPKYPLGTFRSYWCRYCGKWHIQSFLEKDERNKE